MNIEVFNHASDSMPEALGFTEDQYDEIMFKVMQIMKRLSDGRQSERAAACIKWAYEKFETEEKKAAAIFIMGQALEKANMMASVHEMLTSGRNVHNELLDMLKPPSANTAAPETSFMEEFQSLINEFGGEVDKLSGMKGITAIKLEHSNKDEFIKRLNELKSKYSIDEDHEMSLPLMPFGGPIGEA